tara:strand:- start:4 stop:153 length:150 start_codon:yes stop_codon:yes gene_type:complete
MLPALLKSGVLTAIIRIHYVAEPTIVLTGVPEELYKIKVTADVKIVDVA